MYEIKQGCARIVAGAIATAVVSAIGTPAPARAVSFTLDSSNNNSGTFTFTGEIDTVNITTTGIYTIDAFGAQGGSSGNNPGGKGGQLRADFNLTAGTILSILVGQQGGNGVLSGSSIGTGGSNGVGAGDIGIYNNSAIAGSIVSNNAVNSGNGFLAITFNTPATAVPEPFTIIGTIVGGAAALRMRKKLQSTVKK